MENVKTNWSETSRYIAGIGLALFGIFILYISHSVIPLLIAAALLSVIVRPLILWLQNSVHLSQNLAVIIVYLIIAILFPLALILIMPAILEAGQFLQNLDYTTIAQNILTWLRTSLTAIKSLSFPIEILDSLIDQTVDSLLLSLDEAVNTQPEPTPAGPMIQSVTETLSKTFRTATEVVASLVSSTAQVLFTFLASVYISLSAHTFTDGIIKIAPEKYRREVAILLTRIERTWKAFFQGELVLMVAVGVIVWLGLTILGIPGAPYLGLIAGLLEIIPSIGPLLATIPAVIVTLIHGSSYIEVSPMVMALVVILFYIVVNQIENNILVPKVLGEAVDLPPLVVMTGVLVGAEVGGVLGVILSTPVIATMRDIVHYIYYKILGENPYPDEDESQNPDSLSEKKTGNIREKAANILNRVRRTPQQEPDQPEEIISAPENERD